MINYVKFSQLTVIKKTTSLTIIFYVSNIQTIGKVGCAGILYCTRTYYSKEPGSNPLSCICSTLPQCEFLNEFSHMFRTRNYSTISKQGSVVFPVTGYRRRKADLLAHTNAFVHCRRN
jgi:hypothetical protein